MFSSLSPQQDMSIPRKIKKKRNQQEEFKVKYREKEIKQERNSGKKKKKFVIPEH